jgi:hypothetical protein
MKPTTFLFTLSLLAVFARLFTGCRSFPLAPSV